jgi:hypothetical protein
MYVHQMNPGSAVPVLIVQVLVPTGAPMTMGTVGAMNTSVRPTLAQIESHGSAKLNLNVKIIICTGVVRGARQMGVLCVQSHNAGTVTLKTNAHPKGDTGARTVDI